MSFDDVRAELVRSRGFIRSAETQITKTLAAPDALEEEMRLGGPTFGGGTIGGTVGVGTTPPAEVPDPIITALDPSTGDDTGGGTLSVIGTGFLDGDVIRIDGSNQTTAFVSSSLLTCTIPAHAAGVVDVVVRRGAEDSDAVAFEFVEPAGSLPDDVVFVADFSTAQGTDEDAILDGGRWTDYLGNGRESEVVDATGLDFPAAMANVLKVTSNASGQTEGPRVDTLPVPAVGEHLFYRWYFRPVMPNGLADILTHPIQDGVAIGVANWAFNIRTNINDVWTGEISVAQQPGVQTWPNDYFGRNIQHPRNETVRFEMDIHRTGTSTFQLHCRVYNSSDVLIYSDSNFQNANGSQTLANNPTLNFLGVSTLNGLNAGFNGLSPAPGATTDLYYQGGFMVRTDDWCGPYTAAEEDF